ncbi:hypothetical protein [Streptomyces sirii]|uniref:hypothetical protein n=1 Tax=Streptomyces sirii TaxID=3127701 RepID=UPI003D3622A3
MTVQTEGTGGGAGTGGGVSFGDADTGRRGRLWHGRVGAPPPGPIRSAHRLTALNRAPGDPGLPTPVRTLTYSVQMITGILLAGAGTHFFAERRAERAAGSGSGAETGVGTGAESGAVRCD